MMLSAVRSARAFFQWGALGAVLLATMASQRPPEDNAVLRRIVDRLKAFYIESRPEKAYLHLDKPVYTAGETVWFSAYVVAANSHRADTLSRVLHVELLNGRGRVMARRELRLEAGLAHGALALPDTLNPDTYQLRAYTGWMRNAGPEFFYSRRLEVWPAAPLEARYTGPSATQRRIADARQAAAGTAQGPPDVQFFPEGGNLVAGLESVVAFKATDYAARGLDVDGQVLDAQNHPVASFKSGHLGMGTFAFTPQAGQRYHAVVAPGGTAISVPLPAVQPSGYALHVVSLPSVFLLSVRQRGGSGGPVLLLAQVRGTVAYVAQGQITGNESFSARIPKDRFPAGIVQFTLFDGQGQPLAERLAFAQSEPALRVSLVPDRASYGPRQPVRLHVAVATPDGQPVAARLSLAVTDAGAVVPAAETIASNLLLTSDLAGYVENPGYYFQNPTPETTQQLDALLLTQGWRRFTWKTVLAGLPPAPEYGVERSLGIRGQITQPNGKPVPASQITYLQSKPEKRFQSVTADLEGRFLFNGLNSCDTTRLMLQARTARDGHRLLIRLDPGPPVPNRRLPALPLQPPAGLADALSRSQAQHGAEIKLQFDTTKTIMLGGVTVKGRKAVVDDPRRIYPASAATVLRLDDPGAAPAGTTVLQMLQGRMPGVSVTGTGDNMQVQIRGITSLSGSEPYFLLDGVPVTLNVLAYYPASEAESIEVLKGGQAAIFGSRGSAGVIAVYTRRGNPQYNIASEPAPGVLALRLPGYYCGREFYVPRYDLPATKREYPDLRQATLYWNPSVRTNAAGEADLTFFTSDAKGSFRFSAEGVSGAGQPAVGSGPLLRVE